MVVIVNPRAGGHGAPENLAATLKKAGLDAEVRSPQGDDQFSRLARAAVEQGATTVVAAGGDGTVSAVAGPLVGSESTLGVLPLGTLNHFARDARIPHSLEEAISVLADGEQRQVDCGEVNDRIFVNNSSLGLYPAVVRRRKEQQRLGKSKAQAFAWAALSVFRRHPNLGLRIEADGGTVERRTPLLFVGNNRYDLEGLRIGHRERLDAGRLCLFLAQASGRLGLLRLALSALLGRATGAAGLDVLELEHVTITAHRKMLEIATDGEVASMQTPLRYRVRPGALRLLVPRHSR
jgi:diacylglycerol kinase family enzyme